MNYSRKNTISQQKNDGQSYSLGITQSSGLEEHVTLYYSYDGTEWVLYTGPFAPTAAKVYAKAVDQAGNESAVSQLAVAVAASQPVKTGDAAPLAVYAALLLTAAAALTAMPVLRRRRVR